MTHEAREITDVIPREERLYVRELIQRGDAGEDLSATFAGMDDRSLEQLLTSALQLAHAKEQQFKDEADPTVQAYFADSDAQTGHISDYDELARLIARERRVRTEKAKPLLAKVADKLARISGKT